MYRLDTTNRCELFEMIAEEIWEGIVAKHAEHVHEPETGITNEIVRLIRMHHRLNKNFGVWSNFAIDEADYGGDIDIFVETDTNRFLGTHFRRKFYNLMKNMKD